MLMRKVDGVWRIVDEHNTWMSVSWRNQAITLTNEHETTS